MLNVQPASPALPRSEQQATKQHHDLTNTGMGRQCKARFHQNAQV